MLIADKKNLLPFHKWDLFLLEITLFNENYKKNTFSLKQLAFRKILTNLYFDPKIRKMPLKIPNVKLDNINILHFVYNLMSILREKSPSCTHILWNNQNNYFKREYTNSLSFYETLGHKFKIKTWSPRNKTENRRDYYLKLISKNMKIYFQNETLQKFGKEKRYP